MDYWNPPDEYFLQQDCVSVGVIEDLVCIMTFRFGYKRPNIRIPLLFIKHFVY